MATSLKQDDAFEWQLDLPPEGVLLLLRAVCVDELQRGGTGMVWNALWGPKAWSIRVEGNEFHLTPLTSGSLHKWLGYEHGTISAFKSGSRVRLDNKPVATDQRTAMLPLKAMVVITPIFGLLWTVLALPRDYLWLGILGVAALTVWAAFALLWLAPQMMRREAADFLDEVFANHCVRANDDHKTQIQQKLAS